MQRYTLVKRMLIRFPWVRRFGAVVFNRLPKSVSPLAYRLARMFVFRDNAKRMPAFERAMSYFAERGLTPDYLEFGVARGTSVISAYHLSVAKGIKDMRIFAFDSFQGLPNSEGGVFESGAMSYSKDTFLTFCAKAGVPTEKICTIPGFFEDSLVHTLIAQHGFGQRPLLVHVDCDLFTSTRHVLNFLEQFLSVPTIIVFDDWYSFTTKDNPEKYGEQRAFCEWPTHQAFHSIWDSGNWNTAFLIEEIDAPPTSAPLSRAG